MNSPQRKRDLRLYHFGATLLALGITLWICYAVLSVSHTIKENYEQTQCNQGLLMLDTTGVWSEQRLAKCPTDIRRALRERHR